MPLILNLDTSTQICSVALASGSELLGTKESHEEKSHSSKLSVFIRDLLRENALEVSGLDAVAVSMGPGSYTGLRIGVSTAKGLAYGSNIPLLGIGTLASLVSGAIHNQEVFGILEKNESALLCPMIDARRMEVYTALYTPAEKIVEEVSAKIIDEKSFLEQMEKGPIVFFGNGAEKCRGAITHPNAFFVNDIVTSAKHMIALSEISFQQKKFEDIAYFEPFYLKDFIATTPKNRIIPGVRSETKPD